MNKHIFVRAAFTCLVVLCLAACTPAATLIPAQTAIPTSTQAPPPTDEPILTQTQGGDGVVASIDTMLSNLALTRDFTGTVLIARDVEVLLSKGYGMADREQKIPNTPETRFRIASITKMFTAMGILILQDQGKLNVQDLVCDLISDCPATWKAITLHHLLTHSSGIPNIPEKEFMRLLNSHNTHEEVIAAFKDLPLDFKPGETWSYSNSGYNLLGYVIEQVSGQTYGDFMQQQIFTPLEMSNTGMAAAEDKNIALGYKDKYSTKAMGFFDPSVDFAVGDIVSNTEDLYKWEQALSTEKLIPKALIDEMIARQVLVPNDEDNGSYGYGWFVYTRSNRLTNMHPGATDGYRSILARYPDDHVTMILLSNWEGLDWLALFDKMKVAYFGD